MPTIKIERATSLNAGDAYDKIKVMMDGDADLKKLDPTYKCQFEDSNRQITANGSKFKAKVAVEEGNSGANVSISVDLPILLSPFKGAVKTSLEKKLDKALA